MITLKNARIIASKLTKNKIPKITTLHDWKAAGLISEVIRFENNGKGRIGFFKETLPVEIVTTAELKEKYSLKQIAKARNDLLNGLDNIKKIKNNEFIDEVIKEEVSIDTAPERLLEIIILKEYANKYREIFFRLEELNENKKLEIV